MYTAALEALPRHLVLFKGAHTAFRRDTARLIEQLARLDVRDAARIQLLVAWFAKMEHSLHIHHTVEDEVLWPAIRDRDPGFDAEQQLMEDEHGELDAALTATRRALQTLAVTGGTVRDDARRAAESSAVRLRGVLLEHLDDEEARALPRLGELFSAEEYAQLDARARRQLRMKPADMAFSGAWYISALDREDAAHMLREAPFALRVLYRLAWRRSYERATAFLTV
jgi:hemerythrin-like domain-containing protein